MMWRRGSNMTMIDAKPQRNTVAPKSRRDTNKMKLTTT